MISRMHSTKWDQTTSYGKYWFRLLQYFLSKIARYLAKQNLSLKRAEMSFVKLDGKSEVIFIVVGVWLCDLVFSHLLSFFAPDYGP